MVTHLRHRPANCDGFQIGIITTLDLETEAVLALFEENFGAQGYSYATHAFDENTYSTGHIAGKPVVLCQLISMGKLKACRAAEQMRLSFRSLSVVFVVGIAGGNPSDSIKPPILLGDVAIGTLVIEMDYGRLYDDQLERKRGVEHGLSKPGYRIASFLTNLRPSTKRSSIMHKIDQHTSNEFHPGIGEDVLYSADHLHKHRNTECWRCEHNRWQGTCEEAKVATCHELGCHTLDNICQTDEIFHATVSPTTVRSANLTFTSACSHLEAV